MYDNHVHIFNEAQQTVKAFVYYTKERSGLGAPWLGRIWLNPPPGG